MPTNLTSNLKIGNKGPYWLSLPYFEPAATGADNATWTCTTDIDLGTVGTQIIIKAPVKLEDNTTFKLNGVPSRPIICNAGGLSTSSYPSGSYLQLVYDGTSWVILN